MDRPFVRLNVAATADGKIDTFERGGASISSTRDKQRVDKLRADSDAVMVGGRTLHAEDPRLTVKSEVLRAGRQALGLPPNPAKVAIASRLELKADCNFLTAGPARVMLFTTQQTTPAQLDLLRSSGAQVYVMEGGHVALEDALRMLKDIGIQRLLQPGEQGRLAFIQGFIRAALAALVHQAFQLAFHCDQVVKQQLAQHHFQISSGIDRTGLVGDFLRLETTDDQDKAIHLGQLV